VTWAKGEYDSIHGRITSSWRLEGTRFLLEVSIPANTSATVVLPAVNASSVTESGKPAKQADGVRFLRLEDGQAWLELESGQYRFASAVFNL
jgi:alpha-L-rhamnosidase